jgi:hypothetical protein
MEAKFPVGGSRKAVYDYLRSFGFVQSRHSDKCWTRADGLEVHIYGTGSCAKVTHNTKGVLFDGTLDDMGKYMPAAYAAAYAG